MADFPKVDVGQVAGPRNVEMRFSMREMLILHSATQRRYEALGKKARWINGHRYGHKAMRLSE
jgi:hypothetical protein